MDRDGSYRDGRKRMIDSGLMVSSPRTIRNAESMQRRSIMTPQQIKALRQLDESITRNQSDSNDYVTPLTGRSTARRSHMSLLKENEYSMLGGLSDDDLELDQTRKLFEPRTPGAYAEQLQTTLQCLPDEDPGLAATSSLYFDFKHCMQRHESASDAFNLLSNYEEICTDHEKLLRKLLSRTKLDPTSLNLVDMIQDEKRTWRLISCLYSDRLRTEALKGEDSFLIDNLMESESEVRCVKNLYKENAAVREAQLVIDWLERNAADDLDDGITEKFQHYSESVCWENTLHYLTQRKLRGEVGVGEKNIVSQMDPDAPSRQRKPLADLDHSDEIRLLKFMFSFIRAGKIDKAKELCMHCGQPWRMVSLEGWRLYEDRNKECLTEDGPVEIEGNPLRDLWKLACWSISQDESVHSFERAVYGALCGNLKAMVCVCKSWEDYLWAYYKAMTDTMVEQELRNCPTLLARSRPECNNDVIQLPESYWDQQIMLSSPADIFEKVLAISNEATRLQADSPFHIIQKHLILDDISGLINVTHSWITENVDVGEASFDKITNIHPQLLRFIAHLILLLKTIGVSMDEKKCEEILEYYVRYLATDERSALLVANYTAALSSTKQIEVYSDFLKTVDDRDLRKEYLKMAHEAGLDIPTITKTVVEDIRLGGDVDLTILLPTENSSNFSASEDFNPVVETDITNDDWKKIEALDWLIFDVSQRSEAIKQCNALMRNFLLRQKFAAAKQVMRKVPDGSVDAVYRHHGIGISDTSELPPDDENAIREHLCLQAYLAAKQAFEEWFKFFHNSKPLPPSDPKSRRTNFASRVANDHREEQYQEGLKQWQKSCSDLCKALRDKIYNVLLFPGGWLVDQYEMESEGSIQRRQEQMKALRETCFTNLCLLLLTALKNTDDMKDQCMNLADAIADEDFKIYRAIKKEDGKKILMRIQDIAIDLL